MEPEPVVVPPGEGHRVGNVEFLARTADTPRFTFGIIEIAPGRELEAHVHAEEDDALRSRRLHLGDVARTSAAGSERSSSVQSGMAAPQVGALR